MIAASGDIAIMNPDHVICHLDEGATLNMELTASAGKGYVPSAQNRPADAPIGGEQAAMSPGHGCGQPGAARTCSPPVDAIYSPVRQVAYKVENTRVGQASAGRPVPRTGLSTAGGSRYPPTRL